MSGVQREMPPHLNGAGGAELAEVCLLPSEVTVIINFEIQMKWLYPEMQVSLLDVSSSWQEKPRLQIVFVTSWL